MPMRKSFRVSRELKHLTTTGGKGGRLHRDFFSDWKFECLPVACGNSVVTPAVGNELHSNVIGSRGSTPVQEHDVIDEEEDELLSSSSDDTSNYSSEYVDDDYSDSDDDVDACSIPTVPDEPDVAQRKKPVNGNRVVWYPSLVSVLQAIGKCERCIDNDMELFLLFCDGKIKETLVEAEKKRNKMEYLHGVMNVREWHKEWKMQREENNNRSILTVEDTTYGLATNITIKCERCKESVASIEASKIKQNQRSNSDLCHYNVNHLFSLALQLIGCGGEHGSIIAAFLTLPEPVKWKRQFNVLENFTYDAIQNVKNLSEEEAAQEEVQETVNDEDSPIEQTFLEQDLPLHRIRASYDMGWQVRSSGGRYGSSTGHGLLVGAITKKVLDSVVYNKKCGKCTKHFSKNGTYEDVKQHVCVRNYEGTSKGMEAKALVHMLERSAQKNNVSICTIISDDDSNGRAKAQYVSNGGQLTVAAEQPRFMADPSHRKRVFARAIYNLASAPKKTSKVTKGLATHLKYCYGACVKRNRHLTAEELSLKVYNILDHICDIHDNCDPAWCYNIKAEENGKVYVAPKEHRIDKAPICECRTDGLLQPSVRHTDQRKFESSYCYRRSQECMLFQHWQPLFPSCLGYCNT